MKYDYLELARIMKEAREKKQISTRQLAEKIGISHAEISRFENGLKANIYLISFIKMCEVLNLDVLNTLEDVGLWINEEELFYVLVKCDNENVFKVHARCKGEAMKIVYDFLNENQLIDFGNSKDNILFGVVKDPKDFDKEVIKYFENTNLLPIEDEDFEDENEDIDDTENCDSCEYYCPTCGRCTYDE